MTIVSDNPLLTIVNDLFEKKNFFTSEIPSVIKHSELKTLEWDILNPDWLINLEIKKEENKRYLIWRLRKIVDQALIPISTIQKFPAQVISLDKKTHLRQHS